MEKTLLEKAKDTPTNRKERKISQEEIELAVAWVNGELRTTQVARACEMAPNNCMYRIATSLRAAKERGLISIQTHYEI